MKIKEKITIKIDPIESLRHTRSAFANMHFGGCGAHKSKKDYNRKNLRHNDKKVFREYM